jgi:hypothetical protein
MKYLLSTAALFAVASCSTGYNPSKVEGSTFVNPCERGPFPKLYFINSHKNQFTRFLQEKRPDLGSADAQIISELLCSDLEIYADSQALTERLHDLLKNYKK